MDKKMIGMKKILIRILGLVFVMSVMFTIYGTEINASAVPTYYGHCGYGHYNECDGAGCYTYSIAMLLQNSGCAKTPQQVYYDQISITPGSFAITFSSLGAKYKAEHNIEFSSAGTLSGNYNSKLAQLSSALDTYTTGVILMGSNHCVYAFKYNGEVRIHDPYYYTYANISPNTNVGGRTLDSYSSYLGIANAGNASCSFKACIDFPTDNGYYYGSTVLVQCWAIDKSGLKSVKYSINGGAEKELGVHERTDISSAFPGYPTGREGFRKEVSRSEFGIGQNTVKFTAYCNNGHAHVIGTKNMYYPLGYTVYGTDGTRGSISDTNAVLYAKLVTTERSGLKTGIQVGTSSGNYNLVDHMEDMSSAGYSQLNANGEVEVWFDMQNELGVTLSKGTKYYYRFIASYNGNMYYGDEYSFTTTGSNDTTPPTVVSAEITSYDRDGYTVTATASDNIGVTNIKFPTWTEISTEEDIIWYDGSAVKNGTSTCRINLSDFQNREGYYWTDVRAYDAVGNISQYYRLKIFIDRTAPEISNVAIKNLSPLSYKVSCQIKDSSKLKTVKYGISVNGKENVWREAVLNNGLYETTVRISEFSNVTGTYLTTIKVVDDFGNEKTYTAETINLSESDTVIDKDSDFPFSDVAKIDNNWKYEAVKYVYENEIMNGIAGTDLFAPDNQLNRAMFATVLYRMAGGPSVEYSNQFSDVADGKYYTSPILWASEKGIVNGFSDGSYGVDTNITREQIAKMLYEYASKQGYNVKVYSSLKNFTDHNNVSDWAVEYMQWAVNAGMITGKPNGNGTFRLDPKGEATRAECAKMLMMFMEKYK